MNKLIDITRAREGSDDSSYAGYSRPAELRIYHSLTSWYPMVVMHLQCGPLTTQRLEFGPTQARELIETLTEFLTSLNEWEKLNMAVNWREYPYNEE